MGIPHKCLAGRAESVQMQVHVANLEHIVNPLEGDVESPAEYVAVEFQQGICTMFRIVSGSDAYRPQVRHRSDRRSKDGIQHGMVP